MKNSLYAVILAGGSGTRFWPLSRELYPKQLLKIVGPESMLQRTLRCAAQLTSVGKIYIVTHHQQSDAVRMQAQAVIPLTKDHLITEPKARNTAAAIGLAAIRLIRQDPRAVMVVMPADHVIQKTARFRRAVIAAVRLANENWLVTLGIKPHKPETGYGYIKSGAGLKPKSIYEVERFVEKPDLAKAKRYIKEGGYYWNSGIFIWKASSILDAIRDCMPELAQGLRSVQRSLGSPNEEKAVRKVYDRLDPVSIDYGVLERMKKSLAVVSVEMGWSDVGSWTALEEISHTDSKGNVVAGNVIDLDSRDSILYAHKRLVATIGLSDLVLVDTEDATLVCPKDRVQEVRKIVDILKKRKAEEHLVHRTVWRPWGSFTVLENGERFKIKRIVVNPGARLSLQMHRHRSEHWVVVSGRARVTRGEEVFDLATNQSTYIPMKTRHRLENPGSKPLEIIEVQNGSYLGEDDIVRFQDDYGRNP
jgi:mannose-1-phosphate guanylyltransferase/mannose-6-phosphate isomerase